MRIIVLCLLVASCLLAFACELASLQYKLCVAALRYISTSTYLLYLRASEPAVSSCFIAVRWGGIRIK